MENRELKLATRILNHLKTEYERYGLGLSINGFRFWSDLEEFSNEEIEEMLNNSRDILSFYYVTTHESGRKVYTWCDCTCDYLPKKQKKLSWYEPIKEHIPYKIEELNNLLSNENLFNNEKLAINQELEYLKELLNFKGIGE